MEEIPATHKSVLLHELIDSLAIAAGDTVIDMTAGGGGHARAAAERLENGTLIGLDQDEKALERVRARLKGVSAEVCLVQANFRDVDQALAECGKTEAQRVYFDLGLSSNQLDESGRGFSFLRDEPLLMTFAHDPRDAPRTAWEIVNEWREERIAEILFTYGEERYARRIARAIREAREGQSIERTSDLVRIIEEAVPVSYKHQGIHPATRTFQALRIAANEEIESLEEGLDKAIEILTPGGRIGVISFHSLEDRIVKHHFLEWEKSDRGVRITKKPIVPSEEERRENPRARSAKLRVFQTH